MTPSPSPLESVLRAERPFALIARDAGTVELLVGEVVDVPLLSDIPLTDATGTPREVLALVPIGRSSSGASRATTTARRCAVSWSTST